MELEKAIEVLKQIKRDNESKSMIINNNASNLQIKWSNEDLKNMADIQNRCAKENRAIETVLQALENSIPKEKVEKTLDVKIHNMNYLAYTDWTEHQKEVDTEVANILEIVKQELLEEENEK